MRDIKQPAYTLDSQAITRLSNLSKGRLVFAVTSAKRHNIRIVEIYADRATSASKDIEKRVQFLKMIKDSEKGLFDAVIVYKLDRFARSRYDSATYKYRLKRNGVQLISATENISNDRRVSFLNPCLKVWLSSTVPNYPRKSTVV